MIRRRLLLATALIPLCLPLCLLCLAGCASLSYPEPEASAQSSASTATDQPPLPETVDRAAAEALIASESAEDGAQSAEMEQARSWSELTRLAREDVARFDYAAAADHLDQAAMQVAELPPSHARRRTVFGQRARLALRMASAGQLEEADLLSDRLFEEAEAEPEIGGEALVALAVATAVRREAAGLEADEPVSQLRLLRIAFEASEAAPASSDRLGVSFRVAQQAEREGDLPLARRAIDRTILDAQRIAPTDKIQAASLRIYRARIAAEQDELDVAQASAESAVRIFQEASGGDSNIAIAESTLAEILARRGELTRARDVADEALARLDAKPPIHRYAERSILAAQARVALASGDSASARRRFEQAIALPLVDFEADSTLTAKLQQELAALE